MKKLLFILMFVPFLVNGQTPTIPPYVDLSKYHNDNLIKEMIDNNFDALNNIFNINDTTIRDLKFIDFDLEDGWTQQEGRLGWNDDDKTLEVGLDQGSVLQMGQEVHVRGVNTHGATLYNGTPVFISGAQGSRPTFGRARDTSILTSLTTIGLTTQDIENSANGYTTITGIVRDIPDSMFITLDVIADGELLWLGDGLMSDIRPDAPNTQVAFGFVLNTQGSDVDVIIDPVLGQRLAYLSDMSARGNQAHNDIIQWNNDSLYWEARDSLVIRVLDYSPPHGAMNFADSTTVIALTQNTWAKVTGPGGDLFVVRDADDITIDGDTITISTPGDYMMWVGFSFNGTNGGIYHIAVYKNGGITDWEMHRKTSVNDTGNASMPTYIENLVAGDDLSIWIENTGNDGDVTMISGQIVITMLHPD